MAALGNLLSSRYTNVADWKELRSRLNSEGGRSEVADSLCVEIRELTGDQTFGGDLNTSDFSARVAAFERRLANVLVAALGIEDADSFAECAPPDLCGRVKKRQASDTRQGVHATIGDTLTLGECQHLIDYKNNIVKTGPVFLESLSGFSSKAELVVALQTVNSMRIIGAHGKKGSPKYKAMDLARIYLDKFERCLEELSPLE